MEMVNSLSSQSSLTRVTSFIDVFSAIDLILGEEVLTNLNVEAVIRQGNNPRRLPSPSPVPDRSSRSRPAYGLEPTSSRSEVKA